MMISVQTPAVKANPPPFTPGERLFFDLRWEFAAAGRAVFSVVPLTDIEESQTVHFRLDVETNSFVDIFYKIRERYDSYTDMNFNRSMKYRILSEGKDKKKIEVDFDWKKNQAVFSNFGHKLPPIDINDPSYDPLGSIYRLRFHSLAPHQQISFHVTDGKKNFLQTAYIEKQETIKVPAGTFDTFLLIPELTHFGGIFKKSSNPKLKIWITTDHRHLPVKIQSRVAIGSVIAELASAEF